jgi:hypothetical protein
VGWHIRLDAVDYLCDIAIPELEICSSAIRYKVCSQIAASFRNDWQYLDVTL